MTTIFNSKSNNFIQIQTTNNTQHTAHGTNIIENIENCLRLWSASQYFSCLFDNAFVSPFFSFIFFFFFFFTFYSLFSWLLRCQNFSSETMQNINRSHVIHTIESFRFGWFRTKKSLLQRITHCPIDITRTKGHSMRQRRNDSAFCKIFMKKGKIP